MPDVTELIDAVATGNAPSDVQGHDGQMHSICPLELMLEAIDTAAECIMSRNADAALFVLDELRTRLMTDAALYERVFREGIDGPASVRQ